jgi:processive 1,2-diacylglycerol beta-glucosyltransferase
MNVVAVTGQDARARRRLARIRRARAEASGVGPTQGARLRVLGWTDDIAALMQSASVLLTKPGGVTLAEAAVCALPVVMFDQIPGPERLNAKRFADAGAGVEARGPREAAAAAEFLLRDERVRALMSLRASELARPHAATDIARIARGEIGEGRTDSTHARVAPEFSRRMTA